MTEEELQNEIEKLKAKNYEVIGEKKRVREEADALAEQLEQANKERDEAKAELRRVAVELPRQNMLEEIAMPEMADALLREIEHYYEIGEGDVLIDRKSGEPLELENQENPLKLDHAGIQRLADDRLVPSIRAMIRGKGATGGGATGGSKHIDPKTKPVAPEPRRFGLS